MFYDLHIHSCLSPCGDRDMEPGNIVNMAVLKGLEVIALTDHNSVKNCPPFLKIAKRAGIAAFPGMELCTSEEVHAVCLFGNLGAALAFGEYVDSRLPYIQNDPAIFGEQIISDEDGFTVAHEDKLLLNATEISIFDLSALIDSYGGLWFPAHIDRSSNSLISNLGLIPPDLAADAFELANPSKLDDVIAANPFVTDFPILFNSDAHRLWNISEPERKLDIGFAEKLFSLPR